ncbi:hypothetical protein BD309DRAFT_959978 [Dichomitus squalens]|nr:hypothetical protein BD309DRAFT_959978 [Dichomitus squalens]
MRHDGRGNHWGRGPFQPQRRLAGHVRESARKFKFTQMDKRRSLMRHDGNTRRSLKIAILRARTPQLALRLSCGPFLTVVLFAWSVTITWA